MTIPEMLEIERQLFESGRATAESLMETVGHELAERVLVEYPGVCEILILVGKGNNGGDGLTMARALAKKQRGLTNESFRVRVYLAYQSDLGMLCDNNLKRLKDECPEVEVLDSPSTIPFPRADGLVVDALLGIQAKGILRSPVREIVQRVNAARHERFFRVVAVDLPSGLAGFVDTRPNSEDAAVIADLTLTVGYAKDILCREVLARWVGRLGVLEWSGGGEGVREAPEVLIPSDLATLLPLRNALAYKGSFGHVAIVSGSPGFTGAPILCAQGAQGIGAGLISVRTDPDAYPIVAAKMPAEVMVSAGDTLPEKTSVVVIGPGIGISKWARHWLLMVLRSNLPVVLDADGLNQVAGESVAHEALMQRSAPTVFTPHTGEMARLIGEKFYSEDRERVAREFVRKCGGVLVLKGTRTIVTERGRGIFYNTTGNPGLSTGGSGDTLAGVIGGLIAQGLTPFDAARLGVWLHGRAGDLLLRDRGIEEGMTPSALSTYLSKALLDLRHSA